MKCPGQDMQYWKPGAIFETECPQCGRPVEFFKDDTTRKCGACGHRFVNPQMDFGCAAYCPYAEQCLGTLPEGLAAQKEELLKDRVAVEMKRWLRTDFKRIGKAGRVARYAERIGKAERGNLAVILSAAYLHNLGQSTAAPPDPPGPSPARSILEKLGAREELIAEVCDIVSRRGKPQADESANFRVVVDAVRLEALAEEFKSNPLAAGRLSERIEHSFLTAAGRSTARELLDPSR
ncbi:MAG: phosphohydrolase [Desulfobacterales bacterium]